VVGVWLGNSDHSKPRTSDPANSLSAAHVFSAFVRDYTRSWPVATFRPPDGVVRATIDAWSGGKPGPWTRDTRQEWFKKGTQPGAAHPVDQPGLLYVRACGQWRVDPVKAETGPAAWRRDVSAWVDRARRGIHVKGPYGSYTAYRPGEHTWGGTLGTSCTSHHRATGGGSGPGPRHHRRRRH
jgi:hypothetical protein